MNQMMQPPPLVIPHGTVPVALRGPIGCADWVLPMLYSQFAQMDATVAMEHWINPTMCILCFRDPSKASMLLSLEYLTLRNGTKISFESAAPFVSGNQVTSGPTIEQQQAQAILVKHKVPVDAVRSDRNGLLTYLTNLERQGFSQQAAEFRWALIQFWGPTF